MVLEEKWQRVYNKRFLKTDKRFCLFTIRKRNGNLYKEKLWNTSCELAFVTWRHNCFCLASSLTWKQAFVFFFTWPANCFFLASSVTWKHNLTNRVFSLHLQEHVTELTKFIQKTLTINLRDHNVTASDITQMRNISLIDQQTKTQSYFKFRETNLETKTQRSELTKEQTFP